MLPAVIVRKLLQSARFAAALALVGVTLNALWPLLANAAPRADFFADQICTVKNKAPGSAVGKLPAQLPVEKHANAHCVFCVSGACNASLHDASRRDAAPSSSLQPRARARASAVQRKNPRVFLLAESRAPPAFSLL